jgi:hypothetical protein
MAGSPPKLAPVTECVLAIAIARQSFVGRYDDGSENRVVLIRLLLGDVTANRSSSSSSSTSSRSTSSSSSSSGSRNVVDHRHCPAVEREKPTLRGRNKNEAGSRWVRSLVILQLIVYISRLQNLESYGLNEPHEQIRQLTEKTTNEMLRTTDLRRSDPALVFHRQMVNCLMMASHTARAQWLASLQNWCQRPNVFWPSPLPGSRLSGGMTTEATTE